MKTKTNGSTNKLPRVYEQKVKKIISVVLDEINCESETQMWTAPRTPQNCWARWIVWHFMRKLGMNYVMIGGYTGHDHGTVISGIRKLQIDLKQRPHEVLREIFKNVSEKL